MHEYRNIRGDLIFYFSTTIINLWNQLPDEIVRSNTLNCFKSEIDNYFNDIKYMFL